MPAPERASRRRLFASAVRRLAPAAASAMVVAACDASMPTATTDPGAASPTRRPTEAVASPTTPPRPAASINPATLPGRMVFVGDANLTVLERGVVRKLTGDRTSRQPTWSPDGKRLAFVKLSENSSEILVSAADGSNAKPVTRNESGILSENVWAFRPSWWPDGSKLLFIADATTNDLMVWEVGVDGRNLRPFLITRDYDGGLDRPNLTRDGKSLVLMSYREGSGRSQVWGAGVPNGPWRKLSDHADGAYDPSISPDGQRIAYVARARGAHDLWVMNLDGGGAQRVTHHGAVRGPAWSPDGQYLAYAAAEGNQFDLWVATVPAALPSPTPTVATTPTARPRTPSPSPPPTATTTVTPAPRDVRPILTRQVTKGAQVDALSGVSWTT